MAGDAGAPAVFLDRDGTLIEEAGYLDRVERIAFYPWSIDAVRVLNQAAFRVVLVTNQAGVARGIFKEPFVREAHRHIEQRLAAGGARIDGYYYCPHHPDGSVAEYRRQCDCRKPQPGMIRQACADLGIDPSRAFGVGDRWHDVQAATAVGATAVLVRTGYGRTEEQQPRADAHAAAIVDNLIDAVTWILRQTPRHG